MPRAAPRPCTTPGCPAYATVGSKCQTHQRERVTWKSDRERGSSTQRGYGAKWRRLREWVLQRDQWLCQTCWRSGKLSQASEVDHKRAKAHGGTDNPSNLEAICRPCHQAKTAREGMAPKGCTEDGTPLDPAHPWNR